MHGESNRSGKGVKCLSSSPSAPVLHWRLTVCATLSPSVTGYVLNWTEESKALSLFSAKGHKNLQKNWLLTPEFSRAGKGEAVSKMRVPLSVCYAGKGFPPPGSYCPFVPL